MNKPMTRATQPLNTKAVFPCIPLVMMRLYLSAYFANITNFGANYFPTIYSSTNCSPCSLFLRVIFRIMTAASFPVFVVCIPKSAISATFLTIIPCICFAFYSIAFSAKSGIQRVTGFAYPAFFRYKDFWHGILHERMLCCDPRILRVCGGFLHFNTEMAISSRSR